MDTYESVVRFFQAGGLFMYPIAAVLVIGLAIAVERWLVLTSARYTNKRAFDAAMALLKKQDFGAVIAAGNTSTVPMSRIVAAGIARFSGNRRRDDIESAMEEGVLWGPCRGWKSITPVPGVWRMWLPCWVCWALLLA